MFNNPSVCSTVPPDFFKLLCTWCEFTLCMAITSLTITFCKCSNQIASSYTRIISDITSKSMQCNKQSITQCAWHRICLKVPKTVSKVLLVLHIMKHKEILFSSGKYSDVRDSHSSKVFVQQSPIGLQIVHMIAHKCYYSSL